MRHRIYINGKPDWKEDGPARARLSGYGGMPLSSVLTSVVVQPQKKRRIPRQPLTRTYRPRP